MVLLAELPSVPFHIWGRVTDLRLQASFDGIYCLDLFPDHLLVRFQTLRRRRRRARTLRINYGALDLGVAPAVGLVVIYWALGHRLELRIGSRFRRLRQLQRHFFAFILHLFDYALNSK